MCACVYIERKGKKEKKKMLTFTEANLAQDTINEQSMDVYQVIHK